MLYCLALSYTVSLQSFVCEIVDMYWSALILSPGTFFYLAWKHYNNLKGEILKSCLSQFLKRRLLTVCSHVFVHVLKQGREKVIRKLEEIPQLGLNTSV